MIIDHDVRRIGSEILLGIALQDAVLDICTTDSQLQKCVELLRGSGDGLEGEKMGTFGVYPVTLSVDFNGRAIIMIDGPDFEPSRNYSAGLYVSQDDLLRLLQKVINDT